MEDLKHYQALMPQGYILDRQLATGGFSLTFLAHKGTQDCVIKILSMHRAKDWKAVELFEREADLLKHLKHRGIPQFLDSFTLEHDGQTSFCLVQQRLPGKSLQEWVDEGRRFSENEILSMASQLAGVLDYLHEINPQVIHRDMKPSNVMLSPEGQAWLIDFGAVRERILGDENQGSTIVGTFGYMPLEQYEGRAEPASDLYGLGMTLIFALSGTPPAQMDKQGLKTDFRAHVSISPKLAQILDKLIEPDIQKRTPSAKVLLKQLLRLNKSKTAKLDPGQSFKNWTSMVRPEAYRFMGKKFVTLFAAFLLIGLLLMAYFYFSRGPQGVEKSPIDVKEMIGNDASETQILLKLMNPQPDKALPAPWTQVQTEAKDIKHIGVTSEGLWLRNYADVYLHKNSQEKLWNKEQLLPGKKVNFKEMLSGSETLYLLHEDKESSVLVYRHKQSWKQIDLPQAVKITAQAVHENKLYLGLKGSLWSFDPETGQWTKHFSLKKSGASDEIQSLAFQGKKLWFGFDYELYHWEKGQPEKIGENKNSIRHLALNQNTLWMGDNKSLIQYDLNSQATTHLLKAHEITALNFTEQLWVGTKNHGMLTPQGNQWAQFGWAQGLADKEVAQFATDKQTLWMLLDNGKVYQADIQALKQAAKQHKAEAQLPAKSYANACEAVKAELQSAQSGEIQKHSHKGKTLAFFQGQQVCPFGYGSISKTGQALLYDYSEGLIQSTADGYVKHPRPPINQYSSPDSLFLDSKGQIWWSGGSHGLWRYAQKKWQRLGSKAYQNYIFAEAQGQVWLGKTNGSNLPMLQTSDGNTLKAFDIGRGFDSVSSLLPTPWGIAIGSSNDNAELRLFQAGEWMQFGEDQGIPGYVVTALASSSEGLWLSTRKLRANHSLALLKPQEREIYVWNPRNGLQNLEIKAMAVDGKKRVWIQDDHNKLFIYEIADLLNAK